MDAGGWLELVAALLGLGLLGVLVAATEALAQNAPAPSGPPDTQATAARRLPAARAAHDWLLRHPRRTRVALLLYQDLALVGVSALLVPIVSALVAPLWWAIMLAVAVTLALAFLVQLVARYYALRHAAGTTLALARPLRGLVILATPVIWALRSLPDRERGASSITAFEQGPVEAPPLEPPGEPEQRMIRGIIGLSQTAVHEIMVPRPDMVAVDENTPLDEVVRLVQEQGYSRIPVFRDTIDQVVGVVHVKDLLPLLGHKPAASLGQIARPPYFIPESKRIDECLEEFQRQRVHMAIVVDEYGAVDGLVTMEDVIEEIVGEIGDEFLREEPHVRRLSDQEALVDGRVSIADVNEALGLDLPSEEFDTVGGLVLTHLGHVPSPGETMDAYGVQISVMSTLGRRVRQVKLVRKPEDTPANP